MTAGAAADPGVSLWLRRHIDRLSLELFRPAPRQTATTVCKDLALNYLELSSKTARDKRRNIPTFLQDREKRGHNGSFREASFLSL